jgi:hypothetical protein
VIKEITCPNRAYIIMRKQKKKEKRKTEQTVAE